MDVFGGNGNRSSWHNPGKQMEDRGKRKSDGDTRLFRKSIVLQISEIERVEIGKKNQLLLYASGKKLITIDFLTENYEYLEETLKRNGKY